ncbi:MAG: hypothetical protein J4215_04340 [Candidatus Diapherotrites archaeon]|uniref:Transmembrane protein n=1 Tax=Candidatus Iainarchaeum sp. TaxID=3101447 RepID=A0A8T4L789_9ARCH|nr:hypothetical protein [Candidatus Diapherotrites archaeon]
MDDEYFEDEPQPKKRQLPIQTNPLFYLAIGLALGFTLSVFVSPEFLESFSNPQKFDGQITDINKWVSDDLRVNLVILRINDSNVATCIDGDACLGYQPGDTVHVTCFGIECRATKR